MTARRGALEALLAQATATLLHDCTPEEVTALEADVAYLARAPLPDGCPRCGAAQVDIADGRGIAACRVCDEHVFVELAEQDARLRRLHARMVCRQRGRHGRWRRRRGGAS